MNIDNHMNEIIKMLNTQKLKDDIRLDEIITEPEKVGLIGIYLMGQYKVEEESGISVRKLVNYAYTLVRIAKRKNKEVREFRAEYLKYQIAVVYSIDLGYTFGY